MTKINVYEINWDATEDEIEECGLPEETIIETDDEELIEEVRNEGYAQDIESKLSDEWGFCVVGFLAEIVE